MATSQVKPSEDDDFPDFLKECQDAWPGCTEAFAQVLWDNFALDPHTHTAEQIIVDENTGQTLDTALEDDDDDTD